MGDILKNREIAIVLWQHSYEGMVLNATFNTISVVSWRSILLVEETGVPGKNHRPVATDKFYHILLYRVRLTMRVKHG